MESMCKIYRRSILRGKQTDRATDISVYAGDRARVWKWHHGKKDQQYRNGEGRVRGGMGGKGEDWKSIAVSQIRPYAKEGVANHVLLSPYGICEILMEVNRAQRRPRMVLRIGSTWETGPYATLNIATQAIVGVVGKKFREEVAHAMKNNGEIETTCSTYGYLRGSQITHERMDLNLRNGWIQPDLDELIYVGSLGRNSSRRACMCQVGGLDCRYSMKYTRRVIDKGEEWADYPICR